MTDKAQTLIETALGWHLRLRDGDDADWAGFADWLAQDPAHNAAYEQVEAMDQAIDPILPKLDFPPDIAMSRDDWADNDNQPVPLWRRPWMIASLGGAAAVALMVAIPAMNSRYDVITAPGETRMVQIDKDTAIALNGDTQLTLDRKDPRFARLIRGEALFTVRHDPARPFMLELNDSRVVDVGTVFDVVSMPGQTRIAVAEGQVDYRQQGQSTPLHQGQQLQDDGKEVRIAPIDPRAVSGWRLRQLTYAGEHLEQVAQDLARVLGAAIEVEAAIARQPVFGTIDLQAVTPDHLPLLASALNARVVRRGKRWILKPAHGRTP